MGHHHLANALDFIICMLKLIGRSYTVTLPCSCIQSWSCSSANIGSALYAYSCTDLYVFGTSLAM